MKKIGEDTVSLRGGITAAAICCFIGRGRRVLCVGVILTVLKSAAETNFSLYKKDDYDKKEDQKRQENRPLVSNSIVPLPQGQVYLRRTISPLFLSDMILISVCFIHPTYHVCR